MDCPGMIQNRCFFLYSFVVVSLSVIIVFIRFVLFCLYIYQVLENSEKKYLSCLLF